MKASLILLTSLLLFPGRVVAQSPFDGTWVIDSAENADHSKEKPLVFLLADGVLRTGERVLKADGKDHEVPPTGYWDTMSVRIVNDHTVEVVSKKVPSQCTRKQIPFRPTVIR